MSPEARKWQRAYVKKIETLSKENRKLIEENKKLKAFAEENRKLRSFARECIGPMEQGLIGVAPNIQDAAKKNGLVVDATQTEDMLLSMHSVEEVGLDNLLNGAGFRYADWMR